MKFRFSEREEVYDVKASLARNIGVLYCVIHSCQWNIMSQPYARQASTTFETLAEWENIPVANRRKYNHPWGSYPCGKNCLTCKYISDGQTSYTFHATGETRPITNHIDCNSKNVIYMIQCNHCSKQYIGETKRRLKDRFNEHCRPVDNPSNSSKPATVWEHFFTNDHSANDITLIPLELIKSNRDSVRKARKAYLIERLKLLNQ